MDRFDWNSLRPGAQLLVHDPPFPPTPARRAHVVRVMVQPRGVNGVVVRMDASGEVVLPRLTAVHHALQPGESCWRCADVAVAAPA